MGTSGNIVSTWGADRKEAERRLAKLRELYDENCGVVQDDLWSPLVLSYAEEIARGRHRISYFPPPPERCIEDPVTDYAQMLQVDRDRFPSLDLIPDTTRPCTPSPSDGGRRAL